MIDPRALQQHFNKVRQRQQPQKPSVPVIPDAAPLTAVQVIPILEPIIQPTVDTSELQKELSEITQAFTTLKQTLTATQIQEQNKIIPSKEEKKEPQKEIKDDDSYNPYGYYSGPLF